MIVPFWQIIIDKYYPEGTPLRDKYLKHSRDVADLALELNGKSVYKLESGEVEAAAMLHDIGICLTYAPSIGCHGSEPYIRHGILGAALLRREGVDEKYARVCERHTGTGLTHKEIKEKGLPLPNDRVYYPRSRLERLVCYADKFYSKSGSGERKTREQLEDEMIRYGTESLERFRKLSAYIEKNLK